MVKVFRKTYCIQCSGSLSLILATPHIEFLPMFGKYLIFCQITYVDSFVHDTMVCHLGSANKTG